MSNPLSHTALLSQVFIKDTSKLNFTNYSGKKGSLLTSSFYSTGSTTQKLCSFWGNISQDASTSLRSFNVSTNSSLSNLIKFEQLKLNSLLLLNNSKETFNHCNILSKILNSSKTSAIRKYAAIIADNQEFNTNVKGCFTPNKQTNYKLIFKSSKAGL